MEQSNNSDPVGNHPQDEQYLSDHTVAVRKALEYCKRELEETLDSPEPFLIDDDACTAARSLRQLREQNLDLQEIDVIDKMLTPRDFRKRYVHTNRPCCVRDAEWSHIHFGHILSCWTDATKINRNWFEQHVGKETKVPVRYESTSNTTVDSEGRAAECETKTMTLSQWIARLENTSERRTETPASAYYLKDWHLQLSRGFDSLYKCPEHFEIDLLNKFFLGFTDGDYRFCYWGPDGSKTGLHSDVLNSHSWSFNVHGTKEWTFYVPVKSAGGANLQEEFRTLTIRQGAGECIFVPAGLKHQVANIGETLSVNHNWISTANLDLTWDCMRSEMKAVEKELANWGEFDFEAQESMLRGCIGLDVTAFFIMLLLGIAEAKSLCYDSWERSFDFVRLSDMLLTLFSENDLKLFDRLAATFAGHKLATLAIEVAQNTITQMNQSGLVRDSNN